ncbi:hypothetical protein EDD22DRAFT_934626, partial [Suillus occidentalis]
MWIVSFMLQMTFGLIVLGRRSLLGSARFGTSSVCTLDSLSIQMSIVNRAKREKQMTTTMTALLIFRPTRRTPLDQFFPQMILLAQLTLLSWTIMTTGHGVCIITLGDKGCGEKEIFVFA